MPWASSGSLAIRTHLVSISAGARSAARRMLHAFRGQDAAGAALHAPNCHWKLEAAEPGLSRRYRTPQRGSFGPDVIAPFVEKITTDNDVLQAVGISVLDGDLAVQQAAAVVPCGACHRDVIYRPVRRGRLAVIGDGRLAFRCSRHRPKKCPIPEPRFVGGCDHRETAARHQHD